MAVAFDFDEQVAQGKRGEDAILRYLKGKYTHVLDYRRSRAWQKRDIDFFVDQWWVELKTDEHKPVNLFAELTVDGRAGYVYKSRADYLLTWFRRYHVAYWTPMMGLGWWVGEHGPALERKVITSKRGGRVWRAEGVLIPISALAAIGWAKEVRLDAEGS